MPIPKYHQFMLPLLKRFADGGVYYRYQFVDQLSDEFDLTPEERAETISNGLTRVADRIGWATSFLKKGGLLSSAKKGYHQVTKQGLDTIKLNLLALTPEKIIELYPDVLNDPFYNPKLRQKGKVSSSVEVISSTELTPDEILEQAIQDTEARLSGEILDQINLVSPRQFERLVVKLLIAMGYGTAEFSMATRYVNDGGIDGIIQADELGFEKIYVQAKKYEGNVGRPDIQKFIGAMTGTNKGVFITTSDFAPSVIDYLHSRQENVVLINGQDMVNFMYKYNQGVSVRRVIEIKSIDSDYFEEL